MDISSVQPEHKINQRTDTEWTSYLATGIAEGFEESNSSDQRLEAWAYLIKSGMAWQLQGSFGRFAKTLIDQDYITKEGVLNWDTIDEALGDD
jgi:hypothetical protein